MPRNTTTYERQTINEMIRDAGWYAGTEHDWHQRTSQEREDLAFAATGCQVAFPTWDAPVNCVHTGCRIRRGEIPPISLTNTILRGEASSGWLRFCNRPELARIFRAIRAEARRTKIYDPWKIACMPMVYVGVFGSR